jgi:hypothetical protein
MQNHDIFLISCRIFFVLNNVRHDSVKKSRIPGSETWNNQEPNGFNMNDLGWSETEPGVETHDNTQGAITQSWNASSQHAPHSNTFV